MAFILFKKERVHSRIYYSITDTHYKLAGYNLLYKLWRKRNQPVERGWSVTADDLLNEHDEGFSTADYALVIDFDPNSKKRIALVEIEAIHVYTYGDSNSVAWSPILLELRDVYYDDDYAELTPDLKRDRLARFELPPRRKRMIEFLYLQGGWNWGRNGSTNAAFILEDARRYFLDVFNKPDQGDLNSVDHPAAVTGVAVSSADSHVPPS
jgi:hypothetical protein